MSVKSTVTLTRKQAINTITRKRLEKAEVSIRESLAYLTNKDLEELLDTQYYDSEFENYEVVDKVVEEDDKTN